MPGPFSSHDPVTQAPLANHNLQVTCQSDGRVLPGSQTSGWTLLRKSEEVDCATPWALLWRERGQFLSFTMVSEGLLSTDREEWLALVSEGLLPLVWEGVSGLGERRAAVPRLGGAAGWAWEAGVVGPPLARWEPVARHRVQLVSAWSYVVLGGHCNSLGRGDCLLIISFPGLRLRRTLGAELCLEISLLTSLWNAGACSAYIVTVERHPQICQTRRALVSLLSSRSSTLLTFNI